MRNVLILNMFHVALNQAASYGMRCCVPVIHTIKAIT